MKIAQNFDNIFGRITPPEQIAAINENDPSGLTGINNFLANIISLIFLVSTTVFVAMVLWAAYDFIYSFGDKEGIAKAKAKMTWAIIGFVILSLSFALFRILEQITGIRFLMV